MGAVFYFLPFFYMNNLLSITDLPKSSIERILDLSVQYTEPTDQLKGKNIVFAFAKPSLRTKIATETAINQLGGKVIHIDPDTFYGGKVLSIESTGTPNT
jgi:ornithine carbamoyltransferase